jgi:maltose O-acetyltransferase
MKEFGLRAFILRMPMPPRTRGRLLRSFGAKVGRNVRVHPITVMDAGWRTLRVGDDAYIGPDCILDLSAMLEIRTGAVLAAGAAVMTHQDAGASHRSPTAARVGRYVRPVTIGRYAFVGARAVILADVADQAVVGAGAVVTKPVAQGTTVVGVPATTVDVDASVDD